MIIAFRGATRGRNRIRLTTDSGRLFFLSARSPLQSVRWGPTPSALAEGSGSRAPLVLPSMLRGPTPAARRSALRAARQLKAPLGEDGPSGPVAVDSSCCRLIFQQPATHRRDRRCLRDPRGPARPRGRWTGFCPCGRRGCDSASPDRDSCRPRASRRRPRLLPGA